jgi:hypothetical protein
LKWLKQKHHLMDLPNRVLVRNEWANLKESTDQRVKNQNRIDVKVDNVII